MLGNRQSAARRTTFWILVLGLALGAVLHDHLQGDSAPAWAQAADSRASFEAAWEAFESGAYREARDLLQELDAVPDGVEPRRFTWLRSAAALRQARFESADPEAMTSARQDLERLLDGDVDAWSARAAAELLRAGQADAIEGRIDDVQTWWERRTDIEAAIPGYVDWADALLESRGARDARLIRIWTNLVAADAPVAVLEDLGPRLLGIPVQSRGRGRFAPVGYADGELARRVAEDLLDRAEDPWVLSHAALVAGRLAMQRADFVAAVAHFERAASLVGVDDGRFAREAREQLARIVDPRVNVRVPSMLRPQSPQRFTIDWRNLRGWKLTVRRIDPQRHMQPIEAISRGAGLDDWVQPDVGEVVWTLEEADAVERASRTEGSPSSERHAPRIATRWLDPLEPGVYVVDVNGDGFEDEPTPGSARAVFVVSAFGVMQRAYFDAEAESSMREFWVVDMRDGSPRADVDVSIARGVQRLKDGGGWEFDWTTASHTTDDDGRVLIPDAGEENESLLVRGAVDGHPLVFVDDGRSAPRPREDEILPALVWTDRPLYRPAESVHVQVVRRSFDYATRAFAVRSNDEFHVRIVDPRGEVAFEDLVRSDANGSVDVAWDIPRAAALGMYRIELLNMAARRVPGSATFEVSEVRLPEFTVSVDVDDTRRVVLGDTLEVVVEASYLFGGAVRGQAEVEVSRAASYPIWPMPWKMPWMQQEGMRTSAPRSIGPRIYPGPMPQTTVRTETVALDENGRAVVRIPTDDRGEDAPSWVYEVTAKVTDTSRRQESGAASITIGRTELEAFLRSERHVVAPGDRAWISLRIQDAMRRGVAHGGTITIQRLDDDGPVPVGDARSVRTDDDGELRFDFVPERTGHYSVRFEGKDTRGFDMEAETVVWVADPRTRDIISRDDAVQLIVDREEVFEDTARVLLLTDTPGAAVLLTTTHARGSTSEVIRLRGTSKLLEIELDPRFRPGFRVDAMRVADYRVHQTSVQVAAIEASRLLDLDLSFETEHVLPGTTAPLRVKATDANGDPVETLFALAVVDEALFAIAPRAGIDPLQTFTPVHRVYVQAPRSMAARLGGYVFLERDENQNEGYGRGEAEGEDRAYLADSMEGAAPVMQVRSMARESAKALSVADDVGGATPFTPTAVRTDFRTTSLWRVGIVTDANGEATVDVPLAESLTSWNAFAVAVDPQTRVGVGEATIRTRKPVMVRLQHPRVFRGEDSFTVAAIVHNETDDDTKALVQFEAGDLTDGPVVESVFVPAHEQARVEFTLDIPFERAVPTLIRDEHDRIVGVEPGSVDVQVAVRSDAGEDALRRQVAVHPFGSGLHVASTRVVDPGRGVLTFDPIRDRLSGSERVTLTVAPSMLATALDALPGLASFPYGCVEQTLSRFVPAVAVRAVAGRMGIDTDRIDPELDRKVADGLDRIASQQNPDGGWGWWGGGSTNPYVTAYALTALAEAHDAGVDVDRSMMQRGRDALRSTLPDLEVRPDDLAYALVAIARADDAIHGRSRHDDAMQRWARMLFDARDDRTAYARALAATALQAFGDDERAAALLRHLGNDVKTNANLGTAHWGETGNYWWRGRGAVETTSFVLRAIVAIAPDHPRREAVARWLVANRRGHMWDSTRSTAHALYALCDHLDGADELAPDYRLIARQNGEQILDVKVDDAIEGGGRFALDAAVIDGGPIELELQGTGRAYVTFEADAFSRARQVEASSNVVAVRREVVRLAPQRTLGAGVVDFEVPMDEGDAIASGDRLRIRLHLTLDHDLDFLMVEDPRVAGAEPTDQRSGHFGGFGLWGHREIRDDRTAFFFDALREGEHVIEYEVVAESPGTFHVGPARAIAMYLPDVAGNSTRTSVEIVAAPDSDARGR